MAALVLVAAVGDNGVIGVAGGLPWRLRSDLRRFRAITMGKPIVMGRRTFDAIGRALDGRTNIVVSRNRAFAEAGVLVAYNLEEALRLAEIDARTRGAAEICFIGGGQIYEEVMPRADRLYVTHVHAAPGGDTVFPPIDPGEWAETSREALPRAEGDSADAELVVYDRRR